MDYNLHSYRNGLALVEAVPHLTGLWREVQSALAALDFAALDKAAGASRGVSTELRGELKRHLESAGWLAEQQYYRAPGHGTTWAVNFCKGASMAAGRPTGMAVNVETGHASGIQRALLGLLYASTRPEPENKTRVGRDSVGVLVTVNESLRKAGRIDGSATTYEKTLPHLDLMADSLTTPMVVVGLKGPPTN